MPLLNVLLSGTFASLGGLLGKLSGNTFLEHVWMNYAVQLGLFAMMLVCNGAMWTLYVKALQDHSSLKATVVSSSVNFFLSGLFGVLIFNEVTGWLWWSGICLVLIGLVVINSDQVKQD